MSGWKPGDIALCITNKSVKNVPIIPQMGKFYTVRKFYPNMTFFNAAKGTSEFLSALLLEDGPNNYLIDKRGNTVDQAPLWAASRFIKVTPPEDMEELEIERVIENVE